MTWVPFTMLACVIAAAAVSDLKSRRIPNLLILAGLALALAWHVLGPPGRWSFDRDAAGAVGAAGWLFGASALLAVFFPFYALRAMGAGDVKLMMVVGAFFGARPGAWSQLVGVALSVLVTGGALALLRIVGARRGAQVWSNLMIILAPGHAADRRAAAFDPKVDTADRMPYALAIGAGVLIYLAGTWNGWIRIL